MPGSSGLFSALQVGLKHSDKGRIKLTPHIHVYLQDFERIALSLATRPTRLAELIPELPSVLGACDAAKAGMGGVLFCPGFAPLLWRAPFPTSVQNRLVSFANPHGDLTNSDLEQAGILAQANVATEQYDLRELTLATLCDNTAAVSRNRKGSITVNGPPANMCQSTSLH